MSNKYIKMMGSNFTEQNYLNIESTLISDFTQFILHNQITNKYGDCGLITRVYGDTFDKLFMCVSYADTQKSYDIGIALKSKFVTFSREELKTTYEIFCDLHNELTTVYNEKKLEEIERLRELEQKREEEKKAEKQYQRLRDSGIKSFETQLNKKRNVNTYSSDFYYALGWLIKNMGTVSAALPDYLADMFKKHFGNDTPCRVVDSRHRGPAGYQSQWSWSFKITLKDKDVPSILIPHLNSKCDSISDTSFVWDLIDTYNFKFGKSQDIDLITKTIPSEYRNSFNMGLTV